jgi:predicted nucleotidyltransferase
MYAVAPGQLGLLAAMALGSLAAEYAYRRLTGRRMPRIVDPRLARREEMLRRWEELALRAARVLRAAVRDAEVYLIGSHARGEGERATDIDLLVATPAGLRPQELARLRKRLEEELGLPPYHPLHLHAASKEEVARYRHKRPIETGG